MIDGPEREDSGLDIEAMIEQLYRGNAEREQVAAERPSTSDLANVLHQLADLIYDAFEVERVSACRTKGVQPGDTYAWQAIEGSPAAQDIAATNDLVDAFVADRELQSLEFADTNPFRSSTIWGIGLLNQAVQTAIDHLHGIADSLESGRTVRAPLTMSRTVLEAAATGSFIADRDVDWRERLRRSHNLRMADLKEGANHRTGDGDEDYLVGLEELVAFARASGFDVFMPRRDHEPPTIRPAAGEKEAIRHLIERILPGIGLSTYRTLSTVAHCRPNVGDVLPDEYELPHEVTVWRKAEKIASYAISALLAMHHMLPQVSAYLGWADHEIADDILKVVDFISVGAGWKDNQIRSSLGLPPIS